MRQPILFLLLGLLSACHSPDGTTDPRLLPPLVQAVSVTASSGATRQFSGVVAARVESSLSFRVGGKIIERLVDVGQAVHKGQVLLRLDPADLGLGLSAQQSTVAAARAQAADANANLKRLEGLVQQGAISATDYDHALSAAHAADAQLAAAEAQASLSRNARDYGELRADADGVLVSRSADVGQVVAAGQSLLVLAHAGPREAVVELPEGWRPVPGSSANVRLADGSTGLARLRELAAAADPLSRTYSARYVLAAGASEAPLGSSITLGLSAPTGAGSEIPLTALYDPGSGPGVWRIRNEQIAFQPVHVLALGAESVQVDGLEPGTRIVSLGAHLLHEHESVRVSEGSAK